MLNYQYDAFYDIAEFTKTIGEVDIQKTEKSFFWYIRNNGTYLVDINNVTLNEQVKLAFEHTNVFKLTFYKENQKSNFEVVTIKTIK